MKKESVQSKTDHKMYLATAALGKKKEKLTKIINELKALPISDDEEISRAIKILEKERRLLDLVEIN